MRSLLRSIPLMLIVGTTACDRDSALVQEDVHVTFTDEEGHPTRSVDRLEATRVSGDPAGSASRRGTWCCTDCSCTGQNPNRSCYCAECHPC